MDRIELLKTLARSAGDILAGHFNSGVEIKKKGELDLVTTADEEAERHVVDGIIAAFPNDAIQAEEGTERDGDTCYQWIIDPLDGTTNFAHNFPQFSVSMALALKGEVIAGVVNDPIKQEYFFAEKGKGAWLNDSQIKVGGRTKLGNALAVSGFSYDRRERMDELLERTRNILNHCRGLRRLGSAALDLAYIACGRFDVYVEDGLNPWDIAAGLLLVEEAGGKVSDFSFKNMDLGKGQALACNPTLFNQAKEQLF